MTKYEFLKAVTDSLRAAHPDRDVTAVMVEATLAAMGDVAAAELLGGGEVPLTGLGKLKVRTTAARGGGIRVPVSRCSSRPDGGPCLFPDRR